MDEPVVFTVDELRALGRLMEICLPRFVTEDDEEDPCVDAAALRGMALRGLVTIDGSADVLLSRDLDTRLAPCTTANLLAEVEVEAGGVLSRCAVVARTGGPAALLTEGPAGLGAGFVSLGPTEVPVPNLLAGLCGFDQVTGPAAGHRFTVDVDAHAAADELALEGDTDGAVSVLTGAGVPPARARAWVTAVCTRRRAVAVSVARNLGDGPDGPFESQELRWLAAGDGTAWLVEPGGAVTSVLTPAAPDELTRHLAAVTGG
jgi:hypothetical protein